MRWDSHNIQANAIGLGYIVTEMNRALIDDAEFDAWTLSRTPPGRRGRPEDLVGPVVFLASPASNSVGGQVLHVDGGLLAVM